VILALNTLEKYIKEKWDKLNTNENKTIIRLYLVANLAQRLNCLKQKMDEKIRQRLIISINKINLLVILIAQKEWLKTWNNLISELCEQAKGDLSYICENNMKILTELSDDINEYWKTHMTCKENINLTHRMKEELNKIFELCEFILIYKSNAFINTLEKNNNENKINNNNIDNDGENQIIINILKQAIKLFKEYIVWFQYDKIFNKNIIFKLLHIFKHCDLCKVELIEFFGKLFEMKLSEIEYKDQETLRSFIFDAYQKFMDIFYNTITKKENLCDTYQLLMKNYPQKIEGYEKFIIALERCLINFFDENFDYLKKKNYGIIYQNNNVCIFNSSYVFLNKYNNHLIIGLNYLIQITAMKSGLHESENDQIYDNAIQFWHGLVYKLFTLKENQNDINNNSIEQNNEFNNSANREILVEFLKNSFLYNQCFMQILDRLRELMSENMAKPLELKIVLDENGDVANNPDDNGSFNQNLHESMEKTLIYLALIEPIKTKDLLVSKLLSENQFTNNTKSLNSKKLYSLCWSTGLISGAMNEQLEGELVLKVIRLLLSMMDLCQGKKNREIVFYNLLFVSSQYPSFLHKYHTLIVIIFKKIFVFIKDNSRYVQNYSCETLLKLSNKCGKDILSKTEDDKEVPFFEFFLKNIDNMTNNLTTFMILMIYEAFANIIDKESNQETKENYFKELIKKPNETFQYIIRMKNNNINTLNDVNIIKEIRKFIHINERICVALKKFYWLYGTIIFKDIINIYIYYNEQINLWIQNNFNSNNVQRKDYELINSSILKYFTSLVININDIQIINSDMIMNYGFGALINAFNNNPNQNKDPNMLILFSAIFDVFKNQNYNVSNVIWENFSSNIFSIIKNQYNAFPELYEKFYLFIKSIVKNSIESFYFKYKEIPQLLIDILLYGTSIDIPQIYESSLEAIIILLENIKKININNGVNKTIIIQKFFSSYFYKIFGQVFSSMVDGFHQNGVLSQIKIIHLLIKNIDDESLFGKNEKFNFRQLLIKELPGKCPNLSQNQIQSFCYAIFNYSRNERSFKMTIKDFLTAQKIFGKEDEPLYEEEKDKQIKLAKEIELKREREKYLPRPQYNESYSVANYQFSDSYN
jgi:hypothetical protein